MTLEEKRELHKVISQMLADAGINQTTLKEMAQQEVSNKAQRAVQQEIERLNKDYGGDYIYDMIRRKVQRVFDGCERIGHENIVDIVKDEIRRRVINVEFLKR